jgi:hypothetical protein
MFVLFLQTPVPDTLPPGRAGPGQAGQTGPQRPLTKPLKTWAVFCKDGLSAMLARIRGLNVRARTDAGELGLRN